MTAIAPDLLALFGVGPDTAASLLVAAGDNPERRRSEAVWAHLCGVSPLQASSGKVTRHPLDRGGDRKANSGRGETPALEDPSNLRSTDLVRKPRFRSVRPARSFCFSSPSAKARYPTNSLPLQTSIPVPRPLVESQLSRRRRVHSKRKYGPNARRSTAGLPGELPWPRDQRGPSRADRRRRSS